MKIMKKGISTIIATIMLVVITIGLISTAYLYFTSIVSVGPVLSIASAYCSGTSITLTLKNDGTAQVNTTSLTWLLNSNSQGTLSTCSPQMLNATSTSTCTVTGASGVNNIMVIGPKNQAGGPVTCS
jgi:FlaG/FlaF family flagellin (archaellin)